MRSSIRAYFRVDALGSSYPRELLAGISTYLSLSYIFIVNPAILSQAGMDVSAVLFATALASGITTIAMGLWANLPFAVAPGLEMNGFFALAAVGAWHLTPAQALGATFVAGVICVALTLTPTFFKLIDAIPPALKSNIGVSVGVFVATTGLYLAKIVVFGKDGKPDFSSWSSDVLT
jgi:AGZA family xanthine/uracil permease-like MFS transporter